MKAAMVSWEYPPQFSGGLGIHCQEIVQALTSIGVKIDFYLPAFKTENFEVPEGVTMHHVESKLPQSVYSYHGSEIWEAVKEFKTRLEDTFNPKGIDIIHAHDWMGVFAATTIAKHYNIPLVWTVHSTEYDRAAGMPVHPGILAIEQEALENVNHTITVSKRMKQNLVLHYNADPENISVIYNGIDPARFEELRIRDYQSMDGYILFLGRVTGQKGPDDFLEAAKIVLAEQEDVHFKIAGDGDLLNSLRLRAKRWKISNNVEFVGSVFDDKLLDCYKNALIFVLPSISEPFGITVLEAMASGLPAIISTTTGAEEVVFNVIKVEPNQPKELAQAITTLLNNPQLRKNLGEEGAKEVLQLSWKHIADQTRSLYLQLLGPR
ncbi:glycosyltransferase family 4 protein [Bacillus salipaludis]|uniref:Glycosyltransferase family 4 protein n=1 Tax=Bacillus salipaludis TaxID=2547811 RepID=A0ABW8RQE0_9BACI